MWTIDDAAEMDRLLDLGVDGIMTDRPAVLKDVLERRGAVGDVTARPTTSTAIEPASSTTPPMVVTVGPRPRTRAPVLASGRRMIGDVPTAPA